jgi:hypothetical protein
MELQAATISALQRRLTLPTHVEEELSRHRRSAVAPIRAGLAHFVKGAWSLPEAALARLLEADPGLPRFVMNKELWTVDGDRIGCPDGYFPEAGVALQVHSRTYHSGIDESGRDRWTATVEKDSSLAEHGVVVVPLSPSSIDRRPSQVLGRIRRALAANSGRDLSHVVVRET